MNCTPLVRLLPWAAAGSRDQIWAQTSWPGTSAGSKPVAIHALKSRRKRPPHRPEPVAAWIGVRMLGGSVHSVPPSSGMLLAPVLE